MLSGTVEGLWLTLIKFDMFKGHEWIHDSQHRREMACEFVDRYAHHIVDDYAD